MLYLLDSNVLITANATYYESGRIPQFWEWIAQEAMRNIVKLPVEILREITPSREDRAFRDWIDANASNLSLAEEQVEQNVIHVLERGYGFEPTALADRITIENANDALLIAYAMVAKDQRSVVTLEAAQSIGDPLPDPRNRKIPLVCDLLDIHWINTFDLIRRLDFKIPRNE